MDEIFSIKELSKYLKIDTATAYRLTSSGKIPAFKVGRQWRFKKDDIDRWIQEKNIYSRKTGRIIS